MCLKAWMLECRLLRIPWTVQTHDVVLGSGYNGVGDFGEYSWCLELRKPKNFKRSRCICSFSLHHHHHHHHHYHHHYHHHQHHHHNHNHHHHHQYLIASHCISLHLIASHCIWKIVGPQRLCSLPLPLQMKTIDLLSRPGEMSSMCHEYQRSPLYLEVNTSDQGGEFPLSRNQSKKTCMPSMPSEIFRDVPCHEGI